MEVGKEFNDIQSYNEKMAKGLKDKMFFVDLLPKDEDFVFVDFGCADGVMINALYELYPKSDFVGYDVSESMIALAKCRFDYPADNVHFTDQWSAVQEYLKQSNKKRVLILSSVIHEVYSYAKEGDIEFFWKCILRNNFDYICVRDMMPSEDIDRDTDETLLQTFADHLIEHPANEQLLDDFEKIWGPLISNKNFIHFLLKYRYTINWDREVNENYFPIYVEDFVDILRHLYNITYMERFRVPYLDKCIEEDFGIKLEDYTHVKLMFEKKKEKV